MGLIFENENTNEGIETVINEIYNYVPRSGNGMDAKIGAQVAVGDQLSVERGVNSLMQIANGITPNDRKEGI